VPPPQHDETCDVLIAGGGPTGVTPAALTLGAVLVWAVRLPPLAAEPPRAG
jgi:hypothetical protein